MRKRYRLAGILVAAVFAAAPFCVRADSLRAGSDMSGAPFEFVNPTDHRTEGFDLDVLAAMSGKLGRPIAVSNHTFDDLIAAVKRGDFDLAMSAMSDLREREKQVDFIDYFLAGGGIMVPAGNPHRIFAINALCGYKVTVETGTTYELILDAASKACKAVGLGAIDVITDKTDDGAYALFQQGKADAYVTDYPVGVSRVK